MIKKHQILSGGKVIGSKTISVADPAVFNLSVTLADDLVLPSVTNFTCSTADTAIALECAFPCKQHITNLLHNRRFPTAFSPVYADALAAEWRKNESCSDEYYLLKRQYREDMSGNQ